MRSSCRHIAVEDRIELAQQQLDCTLVQVICQGFNALLRNRCDTKPGQMPYAARAGFEAALQ